MDSVDYCDYQNNQFLQIHTTADRSIKTINSNRNATSQFPENSLLSLLPYHVTSCPLSSAVSCLSTRTDVIHSFEKTSPYHEELLLQHLHLDYLDCMDNPLDQDKWAIGNRDALLDI